MSRSPSDWLLGGVGVGMATASASFAAYMIVTAPAQVVGFGSKEFRIFAAYDRRSGARGAGHGPSSVANAAAPATPPAAGAASPAPPVMPTAVAAIAPGIDPEPTGSLPTPEPTGSLPTTEPIANGPSGASVAVRSNDPSTSLPGGRAAALAEFRIRDVVRGQAIVEHRGRLTLVKPGTVLAGAGEVISIERRAEGWVVTTTTGTITGT